MSHRRQYLVGLAGGAGIDAALYAGPTAALLAAVAAALAAAWWWLR